MKSALRNHAPAGSRGPQAVTLLLLTSFVLALGAAPARAEWPHEPYAGSLPVCVGGASKQDPAICSDGAGGTFIAWVAGGAFVQHVDRDGNLLWPAAGVQVTGSVNRVSVVPDGAGGCVVVWEDTRATSTAIYAQRVNAAGTPQWNANGAAVSGTGGINPITYRFDHHAISDGAGGAIVCWEQNTTFHGVDGSPFVVAQRISGSGARQWGTNGVALSAGGEPQERPELCMNGVGGAYVAWDELRGGVVHCFVQNLNAAGVAQWTAGGVQTALSSGEYSPAIAADGAGGCVVAWNDVRFGDSDIGAQRFNSAGSRLWSSSGVMLTSLAGSNQDSPDICADGLGGAIVTWNDGRYPLTAFDVFAQRVLTAGTTAWTANGVALTVAGGAQQFPRIASDGANGAIVVWNDYRVGTTAASSDIYARRVMADGTAIWQVDGRAIATAVDLQAEPVIVADDRGGAIMAWHDLRSGSVFDIYAQRADEWGELGDASPRILSVTDVPNDQGGRVKVSWRGGRLDSEFGYDTFYYNVWRRTAALGWELIGTQPRGPLTEYSLVVDTQADSGAVIPWSVYRVEARQGDQPWHVWWHSRPDSGYSVDDLAPLMPQALTGTYAGGETRLTWTAGGESDLAGYRIYRGATADFVPDRARLAGETASASFVDAAGAAWIYKVTAVDRHGNASEPATFVPSVPIGPQVLGLAAPRPNPARTATTLVLALPRPAQVRLAICDIGGRRVRELVGGAMPAGEHRIEWDLRDASGAIVRPGLYFARLEVESAARSRRVVVAR